MRKRIRPGPWRTQPTNWLAEHFGIDPDATITTEVVLVKSSALGKTENGLAWPLPRVIDAPRPPHPDGNRASRRARRRKKRSRSVTR